ncbi:MAG: peptidoglycan DL-endopeptidase CwlO [Pseudonocardiales bacterium]|nr:peptidoglycan DL-endopeptidase CwlO [Pseudonocardiales bacterium]
MTRRSPVPFFAPIPGSVPPATLPAAAPARRPLRLARKAGGLTLIASLAVLGSAQSSASAATASDPVGYLDQAVPSGSTGVSVQGWAADPDNLAQPLVILASLDGVGAGQVVTAVARPDVVAARGTGPTPGFALTVAAAPGSHTVCVTAVNIAAGGNTGLGCRTVVVPAPISNTPAAHSPFGALEKATSYGNTVTLTGWAADPDNRAQPLKIYAGHDGSPAPVTSAKVVSRPDIAQSQQVGSNQGFSVTITLSTGSHLVCAAATNIGEGANGQLGSCLKLYVGYTAAQIAALSPSGALEAARAQSATSIGVRGWASDPDDRAASIKVVAYLDGAAAATVTASVPRPDLVSSQQVGPNAGYSFSIPASSASHNVCLWAVNIGVGNNKFLGCAALSTPAVTMLPGPAPATPAANTKVVTLAKTFIGQPYVWGGASPAGFDCSGLVQYSYRTAAAFTTPRTAQDQFKAARMIPAVRAVPGDLVFYHDNTGYVYHVGMYTGPGMTVAAIDPAHGVRAQSIWDSTATFGSFTHS